MSLSCFFITWSFILLQFQTDIDLEIISLTTVFFIAQVQGLENYNISSNRANCEIFIRSKLRGLPVYSYNIHCRCLARSGYFEVMIGIFIVRRKVFKVLRVNGDFGCLKYKLLFTSWRMAYLMRLSFKKWFFHRRSLQHEK